MAWGTQCPFMAKLYLLGLGVGSRLGAPDHHGVSVEQWRGPGPALLALLCLFRRTLFHRRYALWARVIHFGASLVPADAVIHIRLDDATMQKTGRPIQGAAHDRNGAGTARQEYRPLWGINLVWAIMRLPFRRWPGHSLRLPIGLALSRTEALAKTLKVPYRSRSALARRIVDHVATALPTRRIRVATDGGYATKVFLRALPS